MTEPKQVPPVELRIEEVTPERALDLIVANTNNRGVRDTVVSQYARDMVEGRWKDAAGEPVHVTPDNELGNGQHRLLAVIESEVTVKMPFLYAPLEWRMIADQGIKRSFGDVLKINYKASDQNKLAASTRLLWEYRRSGRIGYSYNATINDDSGASVKIGKPSIAELEAVYMAEPGVREHIPVCSRLREHGVNMFCSVAIVLDYLLHQADYDDADAFMERVVHGDQLDPGSPILALRRVLGGPSRPNRARTQAAFTIKTWNAWRNGDEIKNLVWRAGGSSPEPFPQIDGMAKTRQPRRRKRA